MAKTLTGRSPRDQWAHQERQRAIAERRMRASLAREVMRAMIALGASHGNGLQEAQAMAEHRENMEAILRRAYDGLFQTVGTDIAKEGPKAHPALFVERKFADRFEAAARLWITTMVANKVTPIIRTTQRDAIRIIRAATQQGWQEGLGVSQIGGLIMSQITQRGGEVARWRANVIARTETHTAAQAAGHEAAGSLGLTLRKEWVAAADERTRETHAAADGQIVGHNDAFTVGGYECQFPGDTSLPAEEVINCRCASVSIVDD